MKEWPGQIVLCVSQIYWTLEVHEAIKDGVKGLRAYWQVLQDQLFTLVALVRAASSFVAYSRSIQCS